ncbi:hypothetical protein TYRP_001163 [Tyrophagus putrescentiae]|nr:hypothetical protein TYRP_001163 [Tyrophagus putrescentiae]
MACGEVKAIEANLGPTHPIHSAPKPVVHHSAPKPVVHHTAPKPAPKPVVHRQPTVPKLPKKVPIPVPRPKVPTKPKTVPVAKPKVPTHPAAKPKVPTHPAAKPKVPTHPAKTPVKTPTHPKTNPKTLTHPKTNPKTPTHPKTNPKTPTHPKTDPKTPVKPPVKTPVKPQPNPAQPKGHDAIADHARSMIGTPYSWGGGTLKGKSFGVDRGAKTFGFDCSGLARYSVYQATGKTIARTAAAQFADKQCSHVPFEQRRAGDLVFFNDGGRIHHVAVVSGNGSTMIHAPQTGDHVKESPIRMKGHMSEVARC